MATIAYDPTVTTTNTEDTVRRISNAQTKLSRVRDLQLLRDILERQPVYLDLADRLMEVEAELRLAEDEVVDALEPTV